MGNTIKNHPIKVAVGTIVTVIFFAISTTTYVVLSKSDMDRRVDNVAWEQEQIVSAQLLQKIDFKELEDRHEDEVTALKERCANNDILFAGIKERLISIEALLMDIKSRQ